MKIMRLKHAAICALLALLAVPAQAQTLCSTRYDAIAAEILVLRNAKGYVSVSKYAALKADYAALKTAGCIVPDPIVPPPLPAPLIITCPIIASVTAAAGASSAVVTYPLATTTGGTAPVTVGCAPASGTTFAAGTTTVSCLATDSVSVMASCTTLVTVISAMTPSTSPSGTRVPTNASQIVDANGDVWTLSGTTILKNGGVAPGKGTVLLWYLGQLYTLGTDNNWWQWTGSTWLFIGPTDPGAVVIPPPTVTGWSTPRQLTTGGNLHYGVDAGNNILHLLHGDGTVYYQRSTDEGATWSANVVLASAASVFLDRPLVAVGSTVFVVYEKSLSSFTDACCFRETGNIYFRKSADAGLTWGSEVQISLTGKAYRLALAVSGSTVGVAWSDFRSGATWDLYLRRSTDGGATWQAETRVVQGTNSSGAQRPDLVMAGSSAHLFWMDGRESAIPATSCLNIVGCPQIYSKRSLDGGATWGADRKIVQSPSYAGRPIATMSSSGVMLVTWEQWDLTTQSNAPYVARSSDNGTTWSAPQKLLSLASGGGHSNIYAVGPTIHLAWHDFRTGGDSADIFYRQSVDEGLTWAPEERVTSNPGNSLVPMFAATAGYVTVIWGDTTNGSAEVWASRKAVVTVTPPPPPPSGALSYVGAFRLPTGRFGGSNFDLAPDNALAFNPQGDGGRGSLFIASKAADMQVAEVSIPVPVGGTMPAAMNTAAVLQPFADPSEGRYKTIVASGYVGANRIGGLLVDSGKLLITYYIYYDASGEQSVFLVSRGTLNLSTLGQAAGPFSAANTFLSAALGNAGYLSGHMTPIPAAWQAQLKGTAILGNSLAPIISRTSFGPAAFSFTPATVGANFTVQPLVYYPQQFPMLGTGTPSVSDAYFTLGDWIHGIAFPGDSVLFFGRKGLGRWCYGVGTTDPSLDGQPNPAAGPNEVWCYDPADGAKGQHAYPYVPYVWRFDANDLAAVAAGTIQPWAVPKPTVSQLVTPWPAGQASNLGGVAYDPATRRIFVALRMADPAAAYVLNPLMLVYQVQ